MHRLLLRAHSSPFDNPPMLPYLLRGMGGLNVGNLLFQASMYKMLMKKDTQIDTISTHDHVREDPRRLAEQINDAYDAFVLPLANAFRISFHKELAFLTDLVRNLTIPCIVPSLGSNATLTGESSVPPSDETVHAFIDAILDKSALIGLRGEDIAAFFRQAGYQEGRHFEVVGCPSMYYYGAKLPVPSYRPITHRSRITYNRKSNIPAPVQHYMDRFIADHPSSYFIPQNDWDFWCVYRGYPRKSCLNQDVGAYPFRGDEPILKADRVKCFTNVPSWIDFVSHSDLHFGTRIHGNIIGVLAGVPTFILAPDRRVLELADFHRIPHMSLLDLTDQTDLLRIFEQTDFSQVLQGHSDRFSAFVHFLTENGLPHVYDRTEEYPEGLPFDLKQKQIRFRQPPRSWAASSLPVRLWRREAEKQLRRQIGR